VRPSGTAEPLTIAVLGNQGSIHVQRWEEALRQRGHEIVPVDLSAKGRDPLRRVRDLLSIRRELRAVLTRPRSLVALHQVPDGLLASGLRGLHPIVASVWGRDVTQVRPGLRGRVQAAQLGAFLRAAEARTATSAFLRVTVRRRFATDAEVVPFGVDLEAFSPPVEARPAGPVRFVYAKLLRPKYGPDVLLDALARLPDGSWQATIAGDGPLRPALEAKARELGVADRVRFVGWRPHAELPDLLRGADVFVMPSREEEFGVAAAEASAVGLPVVATRVGGVPEIVVDGETGLLVPPKDPEALASALALLATNADLRGRLGRQGRERVAERFAWPACVDRMEAIYRVVASRPPRAASTR
jgi:glycosyltransferase involved in cell wall biosynthesis